MHVTITTKMAEAVGKGNLTQFGISKESWSWHTSKVTLNLVPLSSKKLKTLRALFAEKSKVPGCKMLTRDVDIWEQTLSGKNPKCNKVRQFEQMLIHYLMKVPGHRLYKRIQDTGFNHLAYYVSEVEYVPYEKYNPDHVNMTLNWEELSGADDSTITFREADCRLLTVPEALARKGFYPETDELRESYKKEVEKFSRISPKVGRQYLAIGTGRDDLDGNGDDDDNRWWRPNHTLQMERNGEPTRVVMDVFYEGPKTDRSERNKDEMDTWFWVKAAKKAAVKTESSDSDEVVDNNESPEIEIPVHPFCAVFDLSKHLRLRVHVNYLTRYKYEKHFSHKLVLPDEQKDLVRLLIEHKSVGFKDIIAGKGGGAPVLFTGPPGVGKTLTAEVFAESEERALYSVHCSQLGTDPNKIEDALLKIFARGARWNAIVLLDEADVYVRRRGNDLQQNAIVGVFLRVLEYQKGVLFLATNRPEDVDDAIASRCVARLDYTTPTPRLQKRIWEVLTQVSGVEMSQKTIERIVKENPELSGRDVKNLLKLARLVVYKKKELITPKVIQFVKRFKPTGEGTQYSYRERFPR